LHHNSPEFGLRRLRHAAQVIHKVIHKIIHMATAT
jgi:hypothetical protein